MDYYFNLKNYIHSHKTQKSRNRIFEYFLVFVFCVFIFFILRSLNLFISNSIDYEEDILLENALEDAIDSYETISHTVTAKKGDTFEQIIMRELKSNKDFVKIIKKIKTLKIPTRIKVGNGIDFEYTTLSDNILKERGQENNVYKIIITKIRFTSFENNKITMISIIRDGDEWKIDNISDNLNKKVAIIKINIKNNLAATIKSLSLGKSIAGELIRTYSEVFNLSKNLKNKDSIVLLIEKYEDKEGKFYHYGNLIYSSLNIDDRQHKLYKYDTGYYLDNGISAIKSKLTKPLDRIKISSKFGMRKHPIFGIKKMHTGVDFSAHSGTPVKAAGSGIVIDARSSKSGYGRYLHIKHNNSLSTFYGHLRGFASNIKIGSKVLQDQVIGYVGSSGTTTSPHLHFEVRVNGSPVNPLSTQYITRLELTGESLKKFNIFKRKINNILELKSEKL